MVIEILKTKGRSLYQSINAFNKAHPAVRPVSIYHYVPLSRAAAICGMYEMSLYNLLISKNYVAVRVRGALYVHPDSVVKIARSRGRAKVSRIAGVLSRQAEHLLSGSSQRQM